EHLELLREDLLSHLDLFKADEEAPERPAPGGLLAVEDPFLRYRVNVLVDRGDEACAPVLFELHPTHPNLFGRIERKVELGALTTDFTLLKAGALHRANGGFLVLDAKNVLFQAGRWEGLKRCLRSKQVFLEDLAAMLGLTPVEVLQPEPIPLTCRVVLVGEMWVYELLYRLDPDFREIFGVRADFDSSVSSSEENRRSYAGVVAAICAREGLLPLERGAVARLLEVSMRLAEDQQRLSAAWDRIRELLVEADHWARRDGATRTTAAHLSRAEEQRRFRGNLVEEWTLEEIRRGLLLLKVTGEAVGQVNGLAVGQVGDTVVGRPVRISARAGPGAEGVVDIERQAQLGGRVHSKAVMILQGFITGRYAHDAPLALDATLTFEQTYEEIDGDSASLGELAALISALAEVPVRQGIAVTGSLSQDGQAQPVGAVTHKIEAFFAACCALGLDGTQGVVLCASNVQHLNLREEVCAAVSAGRFHVWAVTTADEALEILLGQPMGARQADGSWEEGTVNAKVAGRLEQMSRAVRHLPPRRGPQAPPRAPPPPASLPGEPPVPPVH
ncbi:MAG: Lon protease family protein, partial [Myxococcaceae bacterium]